jgi:hypothetical protein
VVPPFGFALLPLVLESGPEFSDLGCELLCLLSGRGRAGLDLGQFLGEPIALRLEPPPCLLTRGQGRVAEGGQVVALGGERVDLITENIPFLFGPAPGGLEFIPPTLLGLKLLP